MAIEHHVTVEDRQTGELVAVPTNLPAPHKQMDLKGRIIGYINKRREPRIGPRNGTFAELNVRPVEPIAVNTLQDPIRYGETPCRPSRWPKAIFTTIKYNQSISNQEFAYPLFAADKIARYLADGTAGSGGSQLAWRERSNIERPRAVPYGSVSEMEGTSDPNVNPLYAKLLP